ncbi:DUF4352 domain-containing protein [Nocardiopsis kunsanensis]|uniref:DUF4352 domain-containing protein n=1 Tax=Nocardiopsis kunsanensis TaxID=141693 RepID=A0A918X9Z1_9ACTN|nr:DUF4352 domain-containing protein [Nocardiopsis kunsanensis]GHD20313.1 hypothetical protein GCM10007147_12330 [Nocardiopsis kunsanensis]
MTERGPEDGQEREPDREQDPVDRHPPEEWRPGDAGDPVSGGAQPPGEPPHRFPHHDPPVDRRPPEEWRPGDPEDPMAGGPRPPGEPPHEFPPVHNGATVSGPEDREEEPPNGRRPDFAPPPGHRSERPYKRQGDPYQDRRGQQHSGGPPEGTTAEPQEHGSAKLQGDPYRARPSLGPGTPPAGGHGEHPTGAPPEPVDRTGEFSEGPSGLDQSGFEQAGYAPGYGETDEAGAGVGSYPPVDPAQEYRTDQYGRPRPGNPAEPRPPGTYGPDRRAHPPGGGYTPSRPAPWGKILGIGCGVALLLMLVAGGCMAAAMFTVSDGSSDAQEPAIEAPGTSEEPALEPGDVTADHTEFDPSPLYTSGEYTSVEVSVINNSQEELDVNPLYFTMIDQEGQNHSSRSGVGMDDNEIGAEKLSPGQTTSGAVTVEGGDLALERLVFAPIGHQPLEVPIN